MASTVSLTSNLIASVIIVCLGSLQFGYHMAELNSPESIISCRLSVPDKIPYSESFFGTHGFRRCIPLEPNQIGLITSIFSIGGLVGSTYIGPFADKIGRKRTKLLNCVLFLIGSTFNGLSNSYILFLFGRFIAGLAAGAALVVTPVFINEIAPPSHKGVLGFMNQVFVNNGILITQLLSLMWSTNNKWRMLLLAGSVVALIDFALTLFYLDESPVWLVNQGYKSESYKALHKLRGGEYTSARNEVHSWRNLSDESHASGQTTPESALLGEDGEQVETNESPVSLKEYLTLPEYRNSRVIGSGMLILQQLCGINSIIFYGVSVLILIFPTHAILVNVLISVVNAAVTFAAAPLVEKLGRKPLLLTSTSVMGIATILMGFGIILQSSVLSVVGMFTYIGFFAIGVGPIPFFLVGEVTQPEAKATAQSWGISMNWLATFFIGYLFPILKNSWLGGSTYFIFTLMCLVTHVFVKHYVPETKA